MLRALANATFFARTRWWTIVAVTSTMSGKLSESWKTQERLFVLPLSTTHCTADFGLIDFALLLRAAPSLVTQLVALHLVLAEAGW